MNFTASSVLNVRASSSASLMTTAGGVSGSRSISQTAMRRISRSRTAIRSGRQFSADSAISASISASRRTVSCASAEANARRSSAGGSAFGHCRSKNVSIARSTSALPTSH